MPDDWHSVSGSWQQCNGAAYQSEPVGLAEASWELPVSSFLLEVTLQPGSRSTQSAGCGLCLEAGSGKQFILQLVPEQQSLSIENSQQQVSLPLPNFNQASVQHHLRLEVNHLHISISLDGNAARWQGKLPSPPMRLLLRSEAMSASFSAFQWTAGWEDNFDQTDGDMTSLGWVDPANTGTWRLHSPQLCATPSSNQPAVVYKSLPGSSYELVLNARLLPKELPAAGYGFGPPVAKAGDQPLFSLFYLPPGWCVVASGDERRTFTLPETFDPTHTQQFRMISQSQQLTLWWEANLLGSLAFTQHSSRLGLSAMQSSVCFELVRVTALPDSNAEGEVAHAAA